MATVNILQPAFSTTWAENGTVEAIDEAQWKAGWAYIGTVPPSVEQFNKVHQVQDEKSNWLYQQMLSVMTAAGEMPSVGDLNSLRDAIEANLNARFTSNLAGVGWQRLSSGLILQWGLGTTVAGTGTLVTFPLVYPTLMVHRSACGNPSNSSSGHFCTVITVGDANAGMSVDSWSSSTTRTTGGLTFWWFSMGF